MIYAFYLNHPMCPLVASSVMIPFLPLFAQNREILDAESVF